MEDLCGICATANRKYVCPKCGIAYCSLSCYQNLQKHVGCCEQFYRECVQEELRNENDPAKVKGMEEILQRLNEEYICDETDYAEDSDDDEPLGKRLEGISLDNPEEVWKYLTVEEREDFRNFVHRVETTNSTETIPEWIPWWTLPVKRVQEIQDRASKTCPRSPPNSKLAKLHDDQPDIIDPIPTMSSLTKMRPNESVKFGLVNVVGAYAWTVRLFGGDFVDTSNQREVAYALVSLSSYLANDTVLTSFREAVVDIKTNAAKIPELLDGGPGLERALEKDIYSILSGGLHEPLSVILSTKHPSRSYVLSAMSECHRLFSTLVDKSTRKTSSSKNQHNMPRDSIGNEKLGDSLQRNVSSNGSFHASFPSRMSFQLNSKVATKTLRKLHFLLAFANEFDIFE